VTDQMAGANEIEQTPMAQASRRSKMNPVQLMELARLDHKERLEKFQHTHRLGKPMRKARFSWSLLSNLKLNRSQTGALHKAQHSLS